MSETERLQRIEAVRRFSRFYTRRIGVLREGLLDSPFTLAEGRVIYELAHRESTTAAELVRELGLDPGYLSRLLKRLERRGHLLRRPAHADGRQAILALSEQGQAAFADINGRSRAEIGHLLDPLAPAEQARLVAALATVETLLGEPPPRRVPYILRPHQPGDIGWAVQRHGALYAEEYGFDETFEALVAEILAQFLKSFDAGRERCWIAERDGLNVGCVFLVRQSDEVAKLRCLLVEPGARGLGIGARLIDECIRFARLKRYRRITLWTNSILLAAIRLYERAGFRLVAQEPHRGFGRELVGQTFELEL
ncbi:MAG TPA: helix-turn-helix domain-containing GNAT family N-acetyltransferase [Geminicoccaceae bacterium]|nr:helix-turn-helix domain-containing GNAT family N-acetyltransferase [Geminicoccaceae bacterium]